jgi:hypothetical protein
MKNLQLLKYALALLRKHLNAIKVLQQQHLIGLIYGLKLKLKWITYSGLVV